MATNTTRDIRAMLENPEIIAMRERVAQIGALMFDRQLTDSAGGNITARVGDVVCMSPRYSGSKYLWKLQPEDVLITDLDGTRLAGSGDISREAKVHLGLHKAYGENGISVIHAHARNVLVFAAMAQPMPMVLEGTRKFGEIPLSVYAPSHSNALASNVVEAMRGQEERIRKHGAAVIAPFHGLFVMGKDLDAAFDAVERIDTNAYILLMAAQMGSLDLMGEQRRTMENAIKNFVDIP